MERALGLVAHNADSNKARFRPAMSENQPPTVEPTNMPMKVADVMKLIVEMSRCHDFMSAGAAYENE